MDFATIKSRIREISGWSSTGDLTSARLEEIINYIYTIKIPERINWDRLQTGVYLPLVADTGSYVMATTLLDAPAGDVVGTRIRLIKPPVMLYIDDDNTEVLHFTYDADGFWKEFPLYSNEPTGIPTHVLMDGRTLFPRPIPDDAYIIGAWAVWRPAELETGSTIEPDWEQAVIAGSMAMIREDDENWDQSEQWWTRWKDRTNDIMSISQAKVLGRVKARW